MMKLVGRGLAGVAAIAMTAGFSGIAEASPAVVQEGLVNVNLTDVTIQVPVSIAANICDVTVGVLVQDLRDAAAPCESDAVSGASVERSPQGPASQRGLVNVNVDSLAVQVPVSVAANICDVTVGVLVDQLDDAAVPCQATGSSSDDLISLPI
jgi:hypothetical protein